MDGPEVARLVPLQHREGGEGPLDKVTVIPAGNILIYLCYFDQQKGTYCLPVVPQVIGRWCGCGCGGGWLGGDWLGLSALRGGIPAQPGVEDWWQLGGCSGGWTQASNTTGVAWLELEAHPDKEQFRELVNVLIPKYHVLFYEREKTVYN